MITYYHKNTHSQAIAKTDTYRPGGWISVEFPHDKEIAALCETYHLNYTYVADILDSNEIPRLEYDDGTTYVFLRYIYDGHGPEPQTAPLLIITNQEVFITIAWNNFPRLQDMLHPDSHLSTHDRTPFMLHIIDLVVDQYETHINQTSSQISKVRDRFRRHEVGNDDFVAFLTIDNTLNQFLSALLPTSSILRRLLLGRHVTVKPTDTYRINDLLLNVDQLAEEIKSNLKSMMSIRETCAIITNNNLNRKMNILTAITLLIALPNVFFSMYGMNITLPFQHEAWAYGFVLVLVLVTGVVMVVIARSRKIL